jgi:predicted amidohydrolase
MRLALASIRCEKGDLDRNLARHVAVLDEARRARCDLAVFPEMSLTGSVDLRRQPGHLIASDHEVVAAIVHEASRRHVAVLFGIAERHHEDAYITQLYAHDGAVRGTQRKRHLGEGEESYQVGVGALSCQLGAARFGSVLCAEGSQAWAWDQSASGASMVCFSSAPGLHGRRRTDDEWRSGVGWWEQHGLGQAREHAARLGVWVAMATQSGSTIDEDFPGVSAVVSPDGEVVDRLPGRHEGVLVADVPIAVDVEPVRRSIRVLIVDEHERALLAEFGDDATGRTWWVAPGGGMEPGEDDLTTARRELLEEVGRDDLQIEACIGHRGGTFHMNDRWYTQYERWYLCRCPHFEVAPDVVAAGRAEGIRDLRWWSAEEIRAAGIDTGPRNLPDLLDGIASGSVPPLDTDLGM